MHLSLGYHGAANTIEGQSYDVGDNNSLGTTTKTIQSMHLSNNANAQALSNKMDAMGQKIATYEPQLEFMANQGPPAVPLQVYTAPPPRYNQYGKTLYRQAHNPIYAPAVFATV